MQPFPHQIEKAEQLYALSSSLGYAYLAGMPRTGKTYTSILAVEQAKQSINVLVLTKKKAIDGWLKFTSLPNLKNNYKVINYE